MQKIWREARTLHGRFLWFGLEPEQYGYTVCGTIVTHLDDIEPSAKSSLGSLRLISKSAMQSLWERVRLLLSLYRDAWSLDDVSAMLGQVMRKSATSH